VVISSRSHVIMPPLWFVKTWLLLCHIYKNIIFCTISNCLLSLVTVNLSWNTYYLKVTVLRLPWAIHHEVFRSHLEQRLSQLLWTLLSWQTWVTFSWRPTLELGYCVLDRVAQQTSLILSGWKTLLHFEWIQQKSIILYSYTKAISWFCTCNWLILLCTMFWELFKFLNLLKPRAYCLYHRF